MNYLITTFDGFGDGVIYYPILKFISESSHNDHIHCTNNLFFSDRNIFSKLSLPLNIIFCPEYFRKFSKRYWDEILSYLDANNIKIIINLRFIGLNFEKDYFEFKKMVLDKRPGFVFFDSDCINDMKTENNNVRNIVTDISEEAFSKKITQDNDLLKKIFKPKVDPYHIFINLHTRGNFKLWSIKKWAEVVSFMVSFGKQVYLYEGFAKFEREYTGEVVDLLSDYVFEKITLVRANNLFDLANYLKESELLVSVDSGLIHLADALDIKSIGIYLTTDPLMWGGVSNGFYFVKSKHLDKCKNYYQQFGMCMNNKEKCESIAGDKDDIDIHDILNIVNHIYEE